MTGGSSVAIPVRDFSLKDTIESAQPLTFCGEYDALGSSLSYIESGRAVTVEFSGNRKAGTLTVSGSRASAAAVSRRFRLDEDMGRLYARISTDKFMEGAIRNHAGMRVTLNDPWEATLCFVISQFNNVKRIRLIVRSLMNRFGDTVEAPDGGILRALPDPESLRGASEEELLACGTGFRARYIRSVAAQCADNIDLRALSSHSYTQLKAELMELDGVGEKVADCIALMGYGKLDAFPIDVWVKRTMEQLYFDGKRRTIREIGEFARERWGGMAGYANQYLFHYARVNRGDFAL